MRISDWSSDVCSSDLLPSLARARSITQEPTAAELNGASLSLRRRGGDIERLVNGPRAREEAGMRLACIDHRFELSIGKDTERGQVRWEMRQRSEEHTSELQSLMRKPNADFGLKKKKEHK